MMELTIEYWNALAKQMLLVSSLLSGFSITVVANIIVSNKNDTLTNRILKAAIISAGCFLVTVFAMTQITMLTTAGGPLKNVVANDFSTSRIIGISTFMIGVVALSVIIALAGWVKSKQVGIFTTIIGLLTLLLILMTMIQIG